jgi:hypothetical protein
LGIIEVAWTSAHREKTTSSATPTSGLRSSAVWEYTFPVFGSHVLQRTAAMSSTIARQSCLACALYSCVFGFSDRYLYRRLLLCCRSCLSMFICISGSLGIRGVTASRFYLSTVSKTRKASGLTEWTAVTISYKVKERCRLIIRTRRGVCLRAAKPMNGSNARRQFSKTCVGI